MFCPIFPQSYTTLVAQIDNDVHTPSAVIEKQRVKLSGLQLPVAFAWSTEKDVR